MKSEVCIILDHILFLLSAAVILLLLVCSLTYCGNVDFSTYTEKIQYVHCSWKHAVCFVLLTGLCAFLMKALSKVLNRRRAVVIILLSTLLVIIASCVWTRVNPYQPVYDQEAVWNGIVAFAGKEYKDISKDYFTTYPYQGRTVVLLGSILGFFQCANMETFHIINIAAAGMIVVGVAMISQSLFESDLITAVTAILTACFLPIVIYTAYIYGTLLSTGLIMLAFVFLTRFLVSGRWPWTVGMAILIPLAYCIYSGSLIAAIACTMILIWKALDALRKGKKAFFAHALSSAAVMILLTIGVSQFTARAFSEYSGIPKDGGVPSAAWVLMGISSDGPYVPCGPGGYDGSNVAIYEQAGRNSEVAKKIAVEQIRSVGKQYAHGERSVSFFIRKIRNEWTDPWFSSAVATVYLWDDSIALPENLRSFLTGHVVRRIESGLSVYCTGIYALAFIGVLYIVKQKKKNMEEKLDKLAILLYFMGGFFFYILWESKPRYCFPYFISLIPFAAYGMSVLMNVFYERKQRVIT